jgi:hypothetical protein
MAHGAHLVVNVRVLGQLSFSLDAEPRNRTQHARRERTSKREQHGEQQQEPEAKRLHGS